MGYVDSAMGNIKESDKRYAMAFQALVSELFPGCLSVWTASAPISPYVQRMRL